MEECNIERVWESVESECVIFGFHRICNFMNFFILDTVNSWKVDVKLGPLHKGHMGQVRWLSDTILTYPHLEGAFAKVRFQL